MDLIWFHFLLQFITLFNCTIFAGAAVYINVVEHPARLQCGVEIAATIFPLSYKQAAVMQASLAAIGFITGTLSYFLRSDIWWLIGSILLGSVIPFTMLVIMPINKKLLAADLNKNATTMQLLLKQWNKLHAARSVLSITALVILLVDVLTNIT